MTAERLYLVEACTLPTAEQPLRVAEFDALFARHLVRVERPDSTRAVLHLDGGEAWVRDLAARETSCCSFFALTVTATDGAVRVDVDVPEPYVDVLDGLVGLAEASTS